MTILIGQIVGCLLVAGHRRRGWMALAEPVRRIAEAAVP